MEISNGIFVYRPWQVARNTHHHLIGGFPNVNTCFSFSPGFVKQLSSDNNKSTVTMNVIDLVKNKPWLIDLMASKSKIITSNFLNVDVALAIHALLEPGKAMNHEKDLVKISKISTRLDSSNRETFLKWLALKCYMHQNATIKEDIASSLKYQTQDMIQVSLILKIINDVLALPTSVLEDFVYKAVKFNEELENWKSMGYFEVEQDDSLGYYFIINQDPFYIMPKSPLLKKLFFTWAFSNVSLPFLGIFQGGSAVDLIINPRYVFQPSTRCKDVDEISAIARRFIELVRLEDIVDWVISPFATSPFHWIPKYGFSVVTPGILKKILDSLNFDYVNWNH